MWLVAKVLPHITRVTTQYRRQNYKRNRLAWKQKKCASHGDLKKIKIKIKKQRNKERKKKVSKIKAFQQTNDKRADNV